VTRFFKWLGLHDADGRRAWAFLVLLGASGVMTGFAALALLFVREDKTWTFWLGIAAHAQIALCLTGFTAMFIKRDVTVETKLGKVVIKDKDDVQRVVEQAIRSDERSSASSASLRASDEEYRDLSAEQDDSGTERHD
jgi:hypothetical protein